jgi:hypothetical protein
MGNIPAVENLRLNFNSSCCNGEKVDEKESPTPKAKSRKNSEKAVKNSEKSIEETAKEPTDESDIRSDMVRSEESGGVCGSSKTKKRKRKVEG